LCIFHCVHELCDVRRLRALADSVVGADPASCDSLGCHSRVWNGGDSVQPGFRSHAVSSPVEPEVDALADRAAGAHGAAVGHLVGTRGVRDDGDLGHWLSQIRKRLAWRPVLDGIDLICRPFETVVILGNNGTGKSTLLRVVAGMLVPDGGDVRVCGISLHAHPARAKRMLGYVPDATDAFPDLLVAEFATLVAVLRGAPSRDVLTTEAALIDRLGIRSFWSRRISALSFGQRKRMCLLTALCNQPPVLVLDEPTNGLDPGGATVVDSIVQERAQGGLTTLLATNDAPFAERVGGLRYQLQAGTLTAVAP
jgi:ABC-2 type transport system ATP-binding protein